MPERKRTAKNRATIRSVLTLVRGGITLRRRVELMVDMWLRSARWRSSMISVLRNG